MMSRTILNVVLLLLVGGLVVINLTLRGEPTGRNIEVMPEMLESIPFDSFTANPNFEDGQTMRTLVAGTVLHGEEPLDYAKTPEDAVRAGMELVNTLQADDAILARGQAVYRSYCEVCHGSGGGGDGTVAGRAGYPAPPSFLPPEAKARAMPDGQIFHIITYGGVNMPSYAAEVEQEDRWKVILWMRELQNKVAEDSIFGPTADGSAAEVAEAPTTSPVAEQPAEPGEGVTP